MFRKPVKSSLLLLVIVAVSLSLLCGMACQNASIQTQDTTRQAVGAGLRLDGNESNRTKRLEETTDKITHQPVRLRMSFFIRLMIRFSSREM